MNLFRRHGSPKFLRKIRRWLEPKVDPQRVSRVFEEFDDRRGYKAWHARCQAALSRPLPESGTPSSVTKDGLAVLQVMSPSEASGLLAAAGTGQQPTQLKRNVANLEGYTFDDSALLRRLVEASLTAEVDAQCLEYFRSEYYIHWYMLSRTEPVEGAPTVSFMWHCDRGPSAHLKLLVYLNDHAEHGGGTSYLDRAGSKAVTHSGYLFGESKRRTGSLEELSALAGRPLVPYDHRPKAGDAVLFQPSHILHRGITPTLGPRYVFTLCLLPSPVPWAAALDRGAQVDLRHDPLWHADAASLERRFATAIDDA